MLNTLKLNSFRNHEQFVCDFDQVTYISGENGAGKTSILEAIYTATQCRSFKQTTLNHLVQFDQPHFRVELTTSGDQNMSVVYFFDGKRKLLSNQKPVQILADHLMNFPVFLYSPENEGLLSENQYDRRKFLDKMVFYTNKAHLRHLQSYNKLINSKRNLLKQYPIDPLVLSSINEQLLVLSDEIISERNRLIDLINEQVQVTFSKTDYHFEPFSLKYISSPIEVDQFGAEVTRKRILTGPHLDKIKYFHGDVEYEKFSSFGQRKTFSLVCLNACLLTVEENLKGDIILLLDDFEAGLDVKRIALFKTLFSPYQMIITGVSNSQFMDVKLIQL